jgi:hypothetical protein
MLHEQISSIPIVAASFHNQLGDSSNGMLAERYEEELVSD